MRRTILRPTDHDEWLAVRAPYIGASEVAALFEEHPFITAADLAVRKLTGRRQTENAAMRRGIHLEAAIAAWWSDEHGLTLVEPDVLYVYDDVLIATLDRLVAGSDVAVEIKTSNRYVETVPRSWWWQCQSQILCADLKWVELAVLDPALELKGWRIEPDEEAQKQLVDKADAFMGFIHAGEMPPDVELTYGAVSALYPEVETDSVELEPQTARWCRTLAVLQGRIQSLQSDEDTLKAIIARRLGKAAEGRYQDRTLVTWRSVSRRTIDGKRLRNDLPEVAEEYGRTSSYRQMRLKV